MTLSLIQDNVVYVQCFTASYRLLEVEPFNTWGCTSGIKGLKYLWQIWLKWNSEKNIINKNTKILSKKFKLGIQKLEILLNCPFSPDVQYRSNRSSELQLWNYISKMGKEK